MKKPGKANSGAMLRALGEMGPDMAKVVLCALIVSVSKLCLAFAPRVSGYICDRIGAGAAPDEDFFGLCVLLGALVVIGYGTDALVSTIMLVVSDRCVRTLRDKAQHKLMRLPLRYIDMHPAGDILSRLTADTTFLANALVTLVSTASQVVLFATVVTLMFVTDWRLSLAYLLVFPTGILATTLIVIRARRLIRERANMLGQLSSKVADTCAAHPVAKAYGCEERLQRDFESLLDDYDAVNRKGQFMNGLLPISLTAVSNIGYIVCCLISGFFVLAGELTIGEFQAFLLFGTMLLSPVLTISTGVNTVQQGAACAERIFEFLDEEEEADESAKDTIDAHALAGAVDFSHVRFSYEATHPLMRDVSFSVKPGMTAAIVGPTGAGKTTLVNLLMRFYDIEGGSISLDGKRTADIERHSLRGAISIVLQDSWIFDGTIRENIAYGRPEATDDEVRAAARLVEADAFIERLPEGYDTHVSDESAALSSGERQLLCIARAALADRRILVLDEATSQVDARTEYTITKAMERLMEDKTCFVIAHRLFTIRNADIILYMEAGDVKEVGTHTELLERDGRYAALWRAASDA